MKNMPQNGQKRQKVQKPKKCTNENWPIFIPCDVDDHFWWSKQAKNTQKQPHLVGLSENRWKNTKNAISQKGLAKRFWKLVKFMSYMCTLRIKSKQTSYRKVRLDVIWGKCAHVIGYWCHFPPHAALEEEKAKESAKGLFRTDKICSITVEILINWSPASVSGFVF